MFLHGYLSCNETFKYQTEYFSRFFRTINIDITGFGKSKELPYAYCLDDYVNDIKSVLSTLNINEYNLIAHSFGGRIALKIASEDNCVNKLILTGAAGLKPKRSLKYYYKIYTYKIIKRFLSEEKKNKYGSYELKQLTGYNRQSYVKIVNEFLDKKLKHITAKTLIINGENDLETPLYMAKKLNKNIINSSLYIIKNSSHFCFLEKYNEFNIVVDEFLRGL